MNRHGSPIVVVNLVRQAERVAKESLIGDDYRDAVDFLNLGLTASEKVVYEALDFKRASKVRYTFERWTAALLTLPPQTNNLGRRVFCVASVGQDCRAGFGQDWDFFDSRHFAERNRSSKLHRWSRPDECWAILHWAQRVGKDV